ncbi:hypothetical protein Tco_0733898 [Tanacetum coccineum]
MWGVGFIVLMSFCLFAGGERFVELAKQALQGSRFQMSSMGELTFFLGLQVKQKEDGIFISQDKYGGHGGKSYKKFDFVSVKTASTPIKTQKPLVKDEEASDVDVHLYRSMIGSLMYLTASRPDIMFVVCACSRFQVTPKTSHLSAVKRIFRYLKGKPKLGLWYPRVSLFDLEAYSNSDYAGANLNRKSTTGGCQFLGRRLISWQCKKQTIMATSTTEAEYVAAANCCGQVLWIQNQMLDYGFNFMNTKIYIDNESTICIVKNLVFHSKTKHIAIRHHFIRDAYEKKLIQVLKIHTDDNVVDLLTKAFDKDSVLFHKSVKTASTPFETQKPLVKDEEASDVDVHLYRSMIGSLMYLTASRPDIMFAVCACSRFQVTPKTSHLSDVKRIFRYLKGKPKLGLWYLRVSLFDLEAYSDSDYAGSNIERKSTKGGCQFLGRDLFLANANAIPLCYFYYKGRILLLVQYLRPRPPLVKDKESHLCLFRFQGKPKCGLWYPRSVLFGPGSLSENSVFWRKNLDRKSTTGGCQFLGRRLISWQCKKQTIVATSTTEAEYVAAANCCGQNPVYHSKTKHIAIRHHFIRDAYEKKLIQVLKIHTDDNVADLLTKAFDVSRQYGRLFEKTEGNAEFHEVIDFLARSSIHRALIVHYVNVADKLVSISEASIRSDLLFDDADGIDSLPNQAIFDVIKLMGKVFSFMVKKGKHFSGKVTPLFASMLVQSTEDEGAPSERPSEPQPTPSPPHPQVKLLLSLKSSGRNHRGQTSSDKSLSGNEGDMTLQSVYDLCISLCTQSLDEECIFEETVGRKENLEGKLDAKGVCIQIGKEVLNLKKSFRVHTNPLFDELPDETIDYMDTEDAQDVVSTDKEKVSTDRSKDSTDKEKEGTDKEKDSTVSLDEGTDDRTEARISREKEKGVELKDVEETERPRPTLTRSLLTLKPLPKIDPKDKGKKKIEEEDESDTESEDIPEAEKKFKQLVRDEREIEYDFIQAEIEADRF